MSIEAMKQALEALEPQQEHTRTFKLEAAHALRTAIEQAEKQEPPQFPTMLRKMWSGGEVQRWINENWQAPPAAQRPWVGLTEKDFSAINQSCVTKLQAATSAESILKEKNT